MELKLNFWREKDESILRIFSRYQSKQDFFASQRYLHENKRSIRALFCNFSFSSKLSRAFYLHIGKTRKEVLCPRDG